MLYEKGGFLGAAVTAEIPLFESIMRGEGIGYRGMGRYFRKFVNLLILNI